MGPTLIHILIGTCAKAKQNYYSEKIKDNNSDSKTLFQIANTLLHKEKNTSLPSHSSPSQLADRFAGYFTEKIASIRNNLSDAKCFVETASCIRVSES